MYKNILIIFVFISLIGCKSEPSNLVKIEGKLLPVAETIKPDPEIVKTIEPYKGKIDSEMNKVLSYTPVDITKEDAEFESSLGNLVADLCVKRANPVFNKRTEKNIDFAMFNYGGLRVPINKGAIKTKHAFELMPFENFLVVVEMSGEKVKELANYIVKSKKAHPISKELNITLKENDSFKVLLNNKEIDTSKTYYVLTSDYLQKGGDNMNFFKDPINLYKLEYKVRAAMIDYFSEIDTVKVILDNRVKKID